MEGIVFNNLYEKVVEKDRISNRMTPDLWYRMPYQIENLEGELLLAGELTKPQPLTIKPELSGWYKIYICFVNMRSDNHVYFKLTDDLAYDGIKTVGFDSPRTWCATEFAEEVYWKCADLTGQDIAMVKPDCGQRNAASVAWLRFVPMTEEEVAEYKAYRDCKDTRCVHFHFDEDTNLEDTVDSLYGLLTREAKLPNTDVETCTFEISFDYDGVYDANYTPIRIVDDVWNKKDLKFQPNKELAYMERIKLLHDADIKAYAGNRMSVASFHVPYSLNSWRIQFADKHPELYCKMRDGHAINVCSYAYRQTRDYVINNFKKYAQYGFDGFTLIFIRGLHIGFEQPVVERFKELYPDVDPFTLPVTDERLNGVWCEFMTTFMRELKEALPDKDINVLTHYDPQSSKHAGLDVEQWAKEGLITSICQGHMEIYEVLDDCLDTNGFIDVDKYKAVNLKKQTIKRTVVDAVDKVVYGVGEYKKICDKYGIDFYAVMPWPHTGHYTKRREYADNLRAAGAEKFFSWNANQVVWNLPSYHVQSTLGHKKLFTEELKNFYKVISLDGNYIAGFNANWKG